MTNNLIPAIVIGQKGLNPLGVIRSLGEEGVPIIFFTAKGKDNYAKSSKYVKEVVYYETETLVDQLIKYSKTINFKPLLFGTRDVINKEIFDNAVVLSQYYRLMTITPENINADKLMNKIIMGEIAKKKGFNFAKSISLEMSNYDKKELESLKYPVFLKTLYNYEMDRSISKKLDSYNELVDYLDLLGDFESKLVIQEFVEKDYEIGVAGTFLPTNELIIAGNFKKMIENKNDIGLTVYGEFLKNNIVDEEKIFNLLKDLDYNGSFDLELFVV